MSGGHRHGAGPALVFALVATAGVAVLELAGGILSRSLALTADSVHVAMDALAIGVSLAASVVARRPANAHRTFGYARFETLGALANGGLLLGAAAFIAIEAVRRFSAPALPQGGSMAIYAAIGFGVNVVVGIALARAAHGDLNVRAALLHVVGDAVGTAAVAIGGLVVLATHLAWIDPVLSLAVVVMIVVGVVRVFAAAADVLLESAPDRGTTAAVAGRMRAIEGVVGVHDLHVWSIGTDSPVLTAHVLLADARISEASAIGRAIETDLRDGFGIRHVTIQFECENCAPDERIVCVAEREAEAGTY